MAVAFALPEVVGGSDVLAQIRILVTGSREFQHADYGTIYSELGKAWAALMSHVVLSPSQVTVVTGGARGADYLAKQAARQLGFNVERHPADWAGPCGDDCPRGHRRTRNRLSYCPLAGFRRNSHMVRLGADLCLAFFKQGATNRGTSHCARQAELAGIPTWRITA